MAPSSGRNHGLALTPYSRFPASVCTLHSLRFRLPASYVLSRTTACSFATLGSGSEMEGLCHLRFPHHRCSTESDEPRDMSILRAVCGCRESREHCAAAKVYASSQQPKDLPNEDSRPITWESLSKSTPKAWKNIQMCGHVTIVAGA